jgi:hypothetical protein
MAARACAEMQESLHQTEVLLSKARLRIEELEAELGLALAEQRRLQNYRAQYLAQLGQVEGEQ